MSFDKRERQCPHDHAIRYKVTYGLGDSFGDLIINMCDDCIKIHPFNTDKVISKELIQ